MSGGFKVGNILRIYYEIGEGRRQRAGWEDWMNLFLKEGNLNWVIEEAYTVQQVELSNMTAQEVLIRLINPENLNHELKESLKIDLDVPITCRGKLFFSELYIYYHYKARDERDLLYKIHTILRDFVDFGVPKVEKLSYGGRIPKHGETPEQTEVEQIIEILKDLWAGEYMSDYFEDQTNTDLLNYTKANGGTWEDFLKQAWQEEMIQNSFLGHWSVHHEGEGEDRKAIKKWNPLGPGDYVYDEVENYILPKEVAQRAQMADMGDALMSPSAGRLPEDERKDAFYRGGGRKKRRKRRKTKRKKSKRKSKRMGKKRKSKKK